MKKTQAAPFAKKKVKTGEKLRARTTALKQPLIPKPGEGDVKQLIQQAKAELLEKIEQKMGVVIHRLDRVESGIGEILDELRETETMLESEPYEGQA